MMGPQCGAASANHFKNTRWNRIRKRYSSNGVISIKTDAIKRFLEKDCITKNNCIALYGIEKLENGLNPQLVMNMRHEMIKKMHPRMYSSAMTRNQYSHVSHAIHNDVVETHFINHTLNKFRQQLQKNNYGSKKIYLNDADQNDNRFLNEIRLPENLEVSAKYFQDLKLTAIEPPLQTIETLNVSLSIEDVNKFQYENDEKMERFDKQIHKTTSTSNKQSYYKNECITVKKENGVNINNQHQNNNNNETINVVVTKVDAPYKQVHDMCCRKKKEIMYETTEDLSLLNEPMANGNIGLVAFHSPMNDIKGQNVASNSKPFKFTTNYTIMQLYFLKWMHYIQIIRNKREAVECGKDRNQRITIFLDNIHRHRDRLATIVPLHRKLKYNAELQRDSDAVRIERQPNNPIKLFQIAKAYQNKIKIQQDIIHLQRYKLERQERLIMALKLHKIFEQASEDRHAIRNDLKDVIHSSGPSNKMKAKCLKFIETLHNKKDDCCPSDHLQGATVFKSKFFEKMQQRELERNIRHEQAHKRRLQKEAEQKAQKAAIEEAKRLEDEASKLMRIKTLKEKRRQEKIARILKERDRQRFTENNCKAVKFYRTLLLRRIGLESFKRLLQRKRENLGKCATLKQKIFQKTYFTIWRDTYLKIRRQKTLLASDFYEKILKRSAMTSWKLYVQIERSQYNIATDWHEIKLSEQFFGLWHKYVEHVQQMQNIIMQQAVLHYEWHLKWKMLDCWRRLPQILQIEQETESRRQRWRMKIWELLPDYRPDKEHLYS